MPWVFDTNSFIVKAEGVFDTDAMIAAIYGTDDLSLAGIRNALYTLNSTTLTTLRGRW